jgi:hypothetical protein
MKVTHSQLESLKAYYSDAAHEPNSALIVSAINELQEQRAMLDQDADGNWNAVNNDEEVS